jgi:hypothetical protein
MQFYLLVYPYVNYRNRLKNKTIFLHFLKDFDMEKNLKKWFQAQKLKMADESNMAAKTFCSD